jgi:hypothetical protein
MTLTYVNCLSADYADYFFRLKAYPQIMMTYGNYLSADYADYADFFFRLKTIDKSFVFQGL